MIRWRRIGVSLGCAWIIGCAVALAQPAVAAAQTLPPSAATTHSVPATGTGYDLDFTLPTAAKAGCGVCHYDPGLVRLKGNSLVSFHVDPNVAEASAHAGVQCTGCHVGFASTAPHEDASPDWQTEAKSVCKNCHKDQFIAYGQGVHRIEVAPGENGDRNGDKKPLCGDCHGSHAIESLLDDPDGQASIHARGWDACGRCHEDYWDSYNDYYHGAAYKRGALDAPACWDCHGWHDIRPSSDRDSRVGERHLGETCGACHADYNEAFLGYADLIHGREEVSDQVFLYDVVRRVKDFFAGIFGS